MSKDRLTHLDGVRGIAAFAVMIGHVFWPSALVSLQFFSNSFLWVDFFFVLSGFVMARSYLDRMANGMTGTHFMARRFARIYPLHLLTLLAALVYELVKWGIFSSVTMPADRVPFENNNAFSFVCTALLIHSMGLLPASYWNGASWSISAEFFVYLAFALCLVLARRRKALFWTLLIGLQVISLSVLAAYAPDRRVETDYGFFRCALGFGLGVIVEHFSRRDDFSATSRLSWLNLLMAGFIVVLFSIQVEGTILPLCVPFIFALAVWMLVRFRGGLMERMLSSRVCQFLGVLSYSIYMTHGFLQGLLRNGWRVLHRHPAFQSGPGAWLLNEGLILVFIAIVLPVAWLCYRYVEIPAQRWLNSWWDRRASRRTGRRPAPAAIPASHAAT